MAHLKRNPKMPEFEIGIFFSGLNRNLVNSDYNLRVFECKIAAWNMLVYQHQLLKTFDKTFFRDIPRETFEATRDVMPHSFQSEQNFSILSIDVYVWT